MSNELISTNPAKNYEEVGRVTVSTKADVQAAVAAARGAFPAWRDLGVDGRRPYFEKFLTVYKAKVDEIAELQTKEIGKPLQESADEVSGNVQWLEGQLENAAQMLAAETLDDLEDRVLELHHEPFGVAAVITPWNFPAGQMFMGVMQAMIAGNTVVTKNSEECPLTSRFIDECMAAAEFPQGVFSTIYGDGSVGELLLAEDVDLIHFTGSSKVGQMMYQTAAEKFIPCVLEMGGSSPAVVFEDADLTKTCDSVYEERFLNCGQVCCAVKRLLVHESIMDDVVAGLQACAEKQVLGDPLDAATTQGPLVANRILDILVAQVEDAKAKGATIVTGGNARQDLGGAFFEPTIITDVTPDMRVLTEETFGPVLTVQSFSTEEEALQLANDTDYGLSAFVYTKDKDRALRAAQALEAGQVSINGTLYFSQGAPFGGYKKSGMNRGDGKLGYRFVSQAKVIAVPK